LFGPNLGAFGGVNSCCYYYFITGKILKNFDKVSEKFDLARNWAVRQCMTLPVAIISSL